MIALLGSILAVTVRAGTSLVYATVGEIYTERSGILNLGLEGMMIMGAVSAFAVAYRTESAWAGVLTAIIVGGLLASIHAFLTISLRADQTVSGLALTIFGIGLANFLGQRLGPDGSPLVGLIGPKFSKLEIPILSSIPLLGKPLFDIAATDDQMGEDIVIAEDFRRVGITRFLGVDQSWKGVDIEFDRRYGAEGIVRGLGGDEADGFADIIDLSRRQARHVTPDDGYAILTRNIFGKDVRDHARQRLQFRAIDATQFAAWHG